MLVYVTIPIYVKPKAIDPIVWGDSSLSAWDGGDWVVDKLALMSSAGI